ncbi:MAG: hypothetical protein WCE44_12020 [Candidatus Velthaea sp.]
MAGRRAGAGNLIETTARLAVAILLDALAFVVWDVGTRGPVRMLRDLAGGFAGAGVFARGVARFLLGLFAIAVAAIVLLPPIVASGRPVLVEGWTLLAGLAVETLIGADLRARLSTMR